MFTLARRFAYIGIAVGAGAVLLWWSVHIFNPFHLPTTSNVPPDYRAPHLYWFINDGVFVLCPGALLQAFTLEMRGWFSWVMWTLAVLLNGPIYYVIGLAVGALIGRGHRGKPALLSGSRTATRP